MAGQSRLVPRHTDLLDIPLKPVSVRTLTARPDAAPAVDAVERIRGEFVEMRGFSPTLPQAARLFHLPQDECSRILSLLLVEGFIRQTADGRYRLVAD
jgi:hypothetical protein